jgi:hypothetical protein
VPEEGQGENEVVQQVNPTANVAANAAANPLANTAANNPVQATRLWQMHDQELLRRAQYDQDNGPPDDLYMIPIAYAPSASPVVN